MNRFHAPRARLCLHRSAASQLPSHYYLYVNWALEMVRDAIGACRRNRAIKLYKYIFYEIMVFAVVSEYRETNICKAYIIIIHITKN